MNRLSCYILFVFAVLSCKDEGTIQCPRKSDCLPTDLPLDVGSVSGIIYNSQGRVTSVSEYKNYSYNNNCQATKIEYVFSHSRSEYLLIQYYPTKIESTVFLVQTNGDITLGSLTYQIEDNRVVSELFTPSDKSYIQKRIFEYNNDGNVIKETFHHDDKVVVTYEYFFDDKKNPYSISGVKHNGGLNLFDAWNLSTNNIIKIINTNYSSGIQVSIYEYEFTYNSDSYPTSRRFKSSISQPIYEFKYLCQ